MLHIFNCHLNYIIVNNVEIVQYESYCSLGQILKNLWFSMHAPNGDERRIYYIHIKEIGIWKFVYVAHIKICLIIISYSLPHVHIAHSIFRCVLFSARFHLAYNNRHRILHFTMHGTVVKATIKFTRKVTSSWNLLFCHELSICFTNCDNIVFPDAIQNIDR